VVTSPPELRQRPDDDVAGELRAQRRAGVGGQRPWASRQLHRLNELSASSGATAAAAGVSTAFLLAALLLNGATLWLTSCN